MTLVKTDRKKQLQLTVLAAVGGGLARGEMVMFVDEKDVLELVEGFGLGKGGDSVLAAERDVAVFVLPL